MLHNSVSIFRMIVNHFLIAYYKTSCIEAVKKKEVQDVHSNEYTDSSINDNNTSTDLALLRYGSDHLRTKVRRDSQSNDSCL